MTTLLDFHSDETAALLDGEGRRPMLLRGGTVVSVDPAIGTLERGDLLIRGDRIEAVGPSLKAPDDALVLDASERIVMPGLVDAHRHTWEIVLRGIGGDWSLLDYFKLMPTDFGRHCRPEDVHVANLLAATENIEDGITTFGDWADTAGRGPEHSDAAVDALQASGARARFHYADLFAPAQDWGAGPDVQRMWDRLSSREGRVSMQMGIDSTRDPSFPERVALRFAKDRGIPVATHAAAYGWDHDRWIGRLREHGLMGPDMTYIHVVAAPDEYVRMIRDTGGAITMAACSNCNSGQGFPHVSGLCRQGIPVGLGSDNDMRWKHDMFDVMRTTLTVDRLHQNERAHRQGHVAATIDLRSDKVLEMATMGGARALGLQDVVGSLSPGKQADVVVLRPNERAMPHRFAPAAHAVLQGDRDHVETVFVAGRAVKHLGRLTRHDRDAITARARDRRDRLVVSIGEDKVRTAMARAATDPSAPPPPTL